MIGKNLRHFETKLLESRMNTMSDTECYCYFSVTRLEFEHPQMTMRAQFQHHDKHYHVFELVKYSTYTKNITY